jgi:NAD(P)H-dependent FMN reductase
MEEKLVIAVIEGSARDGRRSIHAARFVADMGREQPGVEIIFVDPTEFTFPNNGETSEGKDPRYTDIIARADGFFIITPEYNHSFPGTLKRMLDSEYDNYFRKAVAVAGVSSGDLGGSRGVESLLLTLHSLHLCITAYTPYFPRVQDIFDESGQIHPEQHDKYAKSIQGAWTELLWLARTLKQGRERA